MSEEKGRERVDFEQDSWKKTRPEARPRFKNGP